MATDETASPDAYASFSVAGGDFDPAIWTRYFDVEPDRAIRRGVSFVTHGGRLSRYGGRVNNWLVSSRNVVHDDLLSPHIAFLVEKLRLPRTDLAHRVRAVGARSRFFCFWWNADGTRRPNIDPRLREIAEICGIAIEIDEQPSAMSNCTSKK